MKTLFGMYPAFVAAELALAVALVAPLACWLSSADGAPAPRLQSLRRRHLCRHHLQWLRPQLHRLLPWPRLLPLLPFSCRLPGVERPEPPDQSQSAAGRSSNTRSRLAPVAEGPGYSLGLRTGRPSQMAMQRWNSVREHLLPAHFERQEILR